MTIKLGSRVKHSAYGEGTVRSIERQAIGVWFDCFIGTIVDLSNLVELGMIPESIEIGEYAVYNGKTVYVDDIHIAASKVVLTNRTGEQMTIDRYQTTVQRFKTL